MPSAEGFADGAALWLNAADMALEMVGAQGEQQDDRDRNADQPQQDRTHYAGLLTRPRRVLNRPAVVQFPRLLRAQWQAPPYARGGRASPHET